MGFPGGDGARAVAIPHSISAGRTVVEPGAPLSAVSKSSEV